MERLVGGLITNSGSKIVPIPSPDKKISKDGAKVTTAIITVSIDIKLRNKTAKYNFKKGYLQMKSFRFQDSNLRFVVFKI
jgi:hypothetical protein